LSSNRQPQITNARWYDAGLGRFTQPDNVVPSLGNPQTFNRYSYVVNSPINYIDPSGNIPCMKSIIIDDQITCMTPYPEPDLLNFETGEGVAWDEAEKKQLEEDAEDVDYITKKTKEDFKAARELAKKLK